VAPFVKKTVILVIIHIIRIFVKHFKNDLSFLFQNRKTREFPPAYILDMLFMFISLFINIHLLCRFDDSSHCIDSLTPPVQVLYADTFCKE